MLRNIFRCRTPGFTVLEMAIALAIAGVALLVLLQLLSTSLVAASRADQVSEAAMLARSKLMETTAVEPIRLGSTTGSGPHQLGWRIEISPAAQRAEASDLGRGLLSVSVLVLAPRRGVQVTILELKSLIFAYAE